MIPSWDHTGTPNGLEGLIHLHSSTTSGSACLIKARRRESFSPRQSPNSSILASICLEADSRDEVSIVREPLFFTMSACFLLSFSSWHCWLLSLTYFYRKRQILKRSLHPEAAVDGR